MADNKTKEEGCYFSYLNFRIIVKQALINHISTPSFPTPTLNFILLNGVVKGERLLFKERKNLRKCFMTLGEPFEERKKLKGNMDANLEPSLPVVLEDSYEEITINQVRRLIVKNNERLTTRIERLLEEHKRVHKDHLQNLLKTMQDNLSKP
ncbi:hypothetical protein V8G54_003972 [Vigna mungo]|uniref:Uncharacterized protein n=1 Tax=Vigna mungo TaxID=3915 RepID=A0AAQ3SDN1_VIGMU